MIVGGGMSATFFKARGYEIGNSLVEPEMIEAAAGIERRAAERGAALLLPEDVVVADRFAADACAKTVAATEIDPGWMVLDIGPRALASFGAALRPCRTVVWNGPMGVFEMPAFAAGTKGMAETVAGLDATTVLGGGSTARPSTSLASPTASPTSRRAGARRWSCSKGRRCPAWRRCPTDRPNGRSA